MIFIIYIYVYRGATKFLMELPSSNLGRDLIIPGSTTEPWFRPYSLISCGKAMPKNHTQFRNYCEVRGGWVFMGKEKFFLKN